MIRDRVIQYTDMIFLFVNQMRECFDFGKAFVSSEKIGAQSAGKVGLQVGSTRKFILVLGIIVRQRVWLSGLSTGLGTIRSP